MAYSNKINNGNDRKVIRTTDERTSSRSIGSTARSGGTGRSGGPTISAPSTITGSTDQTVFAPTVQRGSGNKLPENYQQNTKWYRGATPTTRETLARISLIGMLDRQSGETAMSLFSNLQQDRTSLFYNPYTQYTNRAIDNLAALGIDVSNINDDWFTANRGLMQYYVPTANTNGLSSTMTNKRSSPEQKAAYYYNQLMMAEEDTKKAENEWAALQKEVSYKATQSDRNMSDEEILASINWKKYPTLAKMDSTRKSGTPMELNRAVGYSEDAIYGTIWAARNNGGTGNAYQDMINSVTGVGNQWKRNDALAAKLDPDSEQYAPYSVGSTMDTERQYFGVPSFDAHWLKNNKWMLESGTDEDKTHYIKVAEAEEVTAEAEEQLKKLKEQIDAKLEKKNYDPEAVKKSLHILLESGDYNTLVKMDKTRKQGYNIMNLTRAVDYRLEDMEKYIDEKCAEHNAAEVKDDIEYAESIEEAAAGTTEEPAAEEEQLSKDFLGPDDNAYMPDVALVADMSGAPVPIGQFGRGNIDLDNRPVVRNADGTISTERSFSVNIDGKEVLLPTVINGKIVSEEEAIEHYKKTGEHLGIFDTVEEAEEYAEALHQRQEKRYGETGKKFPKELMLASSGGTRVQPTDAARAAMSETEKAIVAEKNKTLSDGIDMAEGAFTPTEKEYMDAAGSVSMDIISQSLNRVKAAGLSGAKNVAKTLGKRTIQNHFTTVLDTTKTMFDYNQNEEKLAALRFQESELAAKLKGLEYVGMEVDQNPESKFSKDGRTYRVGLAMTPDGYAVDWIDDITGKNEYGINDPDEWNALVESPEIDSIIKQETERAALIDEQNQAGVVLTDEQIADQRRLREIRLQIEDAETYQRENEQAYKEAEEQFEKDHKEVRMTLLSNRVLGLDSSDIERAEAVVGYMTQFADYEATQWYAYNPSQMYANAIAAGEDREAVLAAAKQGNDELTTELETAKLVKQYIIDNEMKVPADYMNGLDRHIAKLERDQKDYEYFSLIQNKDFAEIARKGREMEYNSRPIGILGDRRNIDQYYADMENGDAMGGLVYGLKAFTAGKNSIMTQEEKDIYYYLLGSGREKDAKQYVSFLIDPTYGVLNVRSQQKNAEALGESIRSGFGGFTGNNIMAVILSPVSAISALGNYAYNAITGSEYGAYNPLLMINNLRTATREESAKAIDEYYTARFGKDSWQQKLAQAGYEIVTNRADSAMNMIAFSGLFGGLFSGSEGFLADAGRELISSMPMGLSASADAATEAKKKGATDAQAYGVAAVTLLAETVTEAVSLENMSDAFKIGEEVTSGTVKEFLKNWLTKAGISEAFGESMTDIIENYADEKIMGDLSDHADRVWEYRLKGYNPEEAEYRARKDELNSVLRTALISYISPGLDIISTASGRYQYYRELTRDRQQSGDNRSMLEIMRGEKKKAPENPAIARKPFETTEKKPAAKAPAETTAEARPATETVPEAGTETATDAQTKNVVSMEILQSAADSAKTTQTAAVAAALTPENVDTPNVGILAEAAAVRLGRVFGEGTDVRSAVQDIMAGATVGKVQPISVQQALTNAALSENSEAFNVTQSDVFKSLPPDAKAAMLASTVEKDMNNQTVINDIKDSLKAHRINAETKGMIADGGLKDAQPAVDAARDAARNSRLAESMLEDRQAETEAAQQGVDAAREEVQRDPIAGGPVMTAALNKLNSASAVEQEYQQKAQTSQRTEQDAREKADQAVNDKMTEIRQEATDRVNQQMAAEEQAQAEAQAAAEEQAKVDEENRVRQEDADNASDADFDAYVEEFYPDATEEERQHVREIWDRMRNSGQQQQQQQTPEQMSEEDQANRSKFLKSVGKKLGVNIEEVDGMEFGANGSYDRDTNTLRLNKNATIGDKLYAILGHELTHITEQAGEYNKLADSILRILYGNDVSYQGVLDEMKAGRLNSPLAQAVLRRRGTYEQATGLSYENDYYLQEVVADGMGSILKYDAEHPERQQNLINRLVADDPSTARKIMDSIKRFLKQLVGAKGAWQTDMQNTVDLFEKALKSAQANPVKAKQKAPIRFSGTVKGKTTVVRMADGSIHRFNQTADTIAKSVLKDYSTGETASNMSSRLQEVRNDWIAGRTEDAITKLMKTAEEMAANAGLSSKTRATSDLAKAMNGYFGQYILLGKDEAESIAKTFGSVTKANDILANAGVKARMTVSDKTGMALDEVYSGGYNDDPAQRALQLALGEDETPHMEDVIGMLSGSNDPHQAFLDTYDEGAGITEKDLSIDIFNRLVDDVLASNRIDDQQSGDQFQDIAKEYEGTPIGEAAKSPVKKFSITAPVELREDGLMAVHNLSIDNLISNLRKGGFASPSIAVVPTSRNWSMYGNVSIFFGADTIDPKQGNTLYAGDAFTPTLGAGTYNTAEEALEAQRQQPARRIEVDENMREMSRMLDSYKKIRSIDEARTKAYSKNNYVAPVWKHTEAAKNLVAEHVLRESGLDPSDPSFPQEAFEALDEMKSHAEYGMFLAIEEAEAKETLSDDDLREILTRNINEAARELDPEFEGFDFGNDDALFNEFKDLYNYVEENPIQSGMQESKPDRIIGLDEIECVEIPANAPQDLVNELRQYLPEEKIHVYDPMVLGDRARVANDIKATVPGVRFSIGDDLTRQAQPITDRNGDETDAEELRGGTVVLDTNRYSLNSFTPSEQERTRQALLAATNPDGSKRFTEDQVDKYLKDSLNIAKYIADHRANLDFKANPNENVSFLKPNDEYYYTLDASTLCAKRLLYQGTFNLIQNMMPDTAFMPDDLIDLANMMREMGYETPCGICYVESRRRWLDKFAQEWLDTKFKGEKKPSLAQLTTSNGLEELRKNDPATHKAFVDAMARKGSANPKVVQLRTEYRGDIAKLSEADIQKVKDIGGLRVQSFSDFETPHLLDMVQAVMDMSARGLTSQAYTKVPNFAWVFGDTGIKINLSLIGKGTGLDENGNLVFDNVEGMNFDEAMKLRDRYSKNVGTILVGINDDHIIAAMGDSRIDFIIPFHKSGWSAEELSKVGTLKGYDDFTDFQNERVIIGHAKTSRTFSQQAVEKGAVEKWIRTKRGQGLTNFTTEIVDGKTVVHATGYKTQSFAAEKKQQDKRIKEKAEKEGTEPGKLFTARSNFTPVGSHQYWDFSKSGRENAEIYLAKCKADKRMPKFWQFLVDDGDGGFSLPQGTDKRSTAIREGYWKTLIDFKMYDNEGNGADQMPVTPNINMDQADRVLKDYDLKRVQPRKDIDPVRMADNNSLPEAPAVAEKFTEYMKAKRARWENPQPGDIPVKRRTKAQEILYRNEENKKIYDQIMGNATAASAYTGDMTMGNTPSIYQEAPTQGQQRMAIDAETGETTRWSLPVVNPVQSSDESIWQPGHSESWFRENGFPIYQDVPLDQQEINRDTSKKGHGTQIASTESTYRKLFDRLKKENPTGWQNMRVLDASSGLGLGTQAGREMGFNVTDIEPFPNSQYSPNYTDYTELLRQVQAGEIEPFDYIVSNAVLNVIPQDTRDNLVDAMGKLLAPGGKLFINVISKDYAGAMQSNPDLESSKTARKGSARTQEGDYAQHGNAAGRGHETFVWGSNSVQKVFSTPELIGYLKDALGDGFSVKRDSIGMTGVTVTKNEEPTIKHSLPSDAPYMAAVERGEMDKAQEMVDKKAQENGYTGAFQMEDYGDSRYSLPDLEQEYEEATSEGNEDWQKQVVNQAAYEAGYPVGAYHGSPVTDITEFNTRSQGEKKENLQLLFGTHFTRNRNFAELYARKSKTSKGTSRMTSKFGKVYDVYLDLGKSLDLQTAKNYTPDTEMYQLYEDFPEKIRKKHKPYTFSAYDTEQGLGSGPFITAAIIEDCLQDMSPKEATEFLVDHKYNSVQYMANYNMGMSNNRFGRDPSIIMLDPEKIKSADPVTYDNAGKPIPLSERFQTNNPDIRYSLPDDSVLERQIREYLANGGSLRTNTPQQQQTQMEGVPAPRADRPQKQRQYGYERAENIPLWHDETIKHLKENSQYDPDTNREQVNRAFDWIRSHANENDETGYYGAIAELESPDFNFASSDGQARMIVTTAMASVKAHNGDASALNDEKRLNDLFNRQGTDIAQALQARKIYFMLTPQTKRHSFQTEIDKINNDYKKKGKKTRVELPNELMEELVNAKTDEELDAALAKARKNIASQMPANWKEKLQAWRMFAMLGNFRTHFRNFDGNLIFTPVVGIKNKVGAVIEAATHQQTRTKTLGLASTEARAFALEDSKQMESTLRGEKKYSEGSKIQQERKMFGTGKGILSKSLGKLTQKLYDFNGDMLEKEDWVFLKRHYRNALAGYMTANKLTAADMTGETLDKARAYAVNEAQKATYRDANSIADWLNNVKNPGGKFLVNAVLPFKKTPANILKRGIEYSPVGIINALTHAQRQFNRGEITVNDLIDKWASGLTGTGIMILGAILSGMGAATGGLDDDDDEFEALKGNQKYAINPGKTINSILGVKLFGEDVSYTVDWAAPPSMPFFVGAAIMDTYKNRSDITIPGVLDALAGITEPVFNLSMLDGVNSMLNVSQYSTKNAITQVGESILTNYATSFVPTLVGQIARTMDTTRRKSYVESGADLSTIQYAIEGLENKIPYLSTTNIPSRDVWGNADTSGMIEALIENTISPGYANRIKNDPVVNELQRIYNADGVTDENRKAVVPKSASKTIGSTKLNAEQYDKYVVTRGQAARETLEALMESPLWQISDDNTRAKMINEAWTYANQIGQHEVTGRKLDGWVLESRTSGNVVNNIISRVADSNKSDYISGYGLELAKAIDDDDGETYDICLQALDDADATRAEIKKPITNYFKPIYQKAYEDDDDELMAEIREKLIETGLGYESKTFKSWIPDEDEDEFENTRWLTTP